MRIFGLLLLVVGLLLFQGTCVWFVEDDTQVPLALILGAFDLSIVGFIMWMES